MAFWLVQRLGPPHESVAGDIAERLAAGRHSSAWLSRQVLGAIGANALRDICEHKLLSLAAWP